MCQQSATADVRAPIIIQIPEGVGSAIIRVDGQSVHMTWSAQHSGSARSRYRGYQRAWTFAGALFRSVSSANAVLDLITRLCAVAGGIQ